MPYSSNSDLPEAVRSRYSSHCQDVWRNVWNSVHERTGDESRAFASANSRAQKCEGSKAMEPQFKIFAPMLTASVQQSDGRKRLHGVASSTVHDRQGHSISLGALSEMERSANSGLTVFLNHEYKVPEDVAGTVEKAVIRKHESDPDIHDLVFDIVINEANQRAVDAWTAIQAGTQLGLSIGAKIPDGGATRDRTSGIYRIDHIDLMETSLVGVPANPRSWVEYAVKSLNASAEPDLDSRLVGGVVMPGAVYEVGEGETIVTITHEVEVATPDERTEEDAPLPEDTPEPAPEEATEAPETAPEAPEEVSASTDIDLATVKIKTPYADVSIDTGNRGQKATDDGSPQAALASEPESGEEDADGKKPNPWEGILPTKSDDLAVEDVIAALQSLEPTVVASMRSTSEVLKAVTSELIETRAALRQRDDEYRALEAMTEKVIANTAAIFDKLSNTPLGRRAVVREASDEFASLRSVYPEAFLDLLKRS